MDHTVAVQIAEDGNGTVSVRVPRDKKCGGVTFWNDGGSATLHFEPLPQGLAQYVPPAEHDPRFPPRVAPDPTATVTSVSGFAGSVQAGNLTAFLVRFNRPGRIEWTDITMSGAWPRIQYPYYACPADGPSSKNAPYETDRFCRADGGWPRYYSADLNADNQKQAIIDGITGEWLCRDHPGWHFRGGVPKGCDPRTPNRLWAAKMRAENPGITDQELREMWWTLDPEYEYIVRREGPSTRWIVRVRSDPSCSTITLTVQGVSGTMACRHPAPKTQLSPQQLAVVDPPGVPVSVVESGAGEVTVTVFAADFGGAVDTYRVQLDDDSAFGSPEEQTASSAGSVTFSGLADSTTYHVRVRAENGDGESDWSASVAATTDDPPPSVFVPDAQLVAAVTAKADAHGNAGAAERLRRIVKGMKGETGGYSAAECRKAAADHSVTGAWKPWCDEIERRENWTPPAQRNTVLPTVGVQHTSGLIEGEPLVFTVTARTPRPSADLTVSLEVVVTGDYGVTAGTRTVTIAAGDTEATLTLSSTDDGIDEADGTVEVTVNAGVGYNAGSGGGGVAIADNDVPEVSISGGSGITEGSNATFILTASPAPHAALTVDVNVSQQGDYGATTGSRTVTIPTSGTATLTVSTTGDDVDEPDGSVTATLVAGSGYTVSATQAAATVTVSDDDDPPSSVFVPNAAYVAAVTAKADAHGNAGAAERLRKIVKGMKGETGGYSAAECRSAADHHGVAGTWKPWCDEIERRENWSGTTPTPTPTPEVGISAGAGVIEGGSAVFTLTATPAPASDLTVSVTVSQQGDFGVTTGSRTVTIGTSGTATLTVATVGDSVDEPDGSVTATLASGSGYAVSTSNGAATVAVSDDDVPEVSISAGSGVTEGGSAVFTLTATPAPAADLTVNVTVAQSGDYGVTTGSRTVTIDTSGTATLTVATAGDSVDEPDGSVTATLASGSGYTVSSSNGAATVTVADDDVPEIGISAGAGVTEGGSAVFTLTATPAPAPGLTVSVSVTQSGDYGVTTGSRTVTIGTSGTATLTVATTGDDVDEPDGSVTATLAAGSGYTIGSSGVAAVSIGDDDDAPAAVFVPDAALVAEVEAKADAHSNAGAAERLQCRGVPVGGRPPRRRRHLEAVVRRDRAPRELDAAGAAGSQHQRGRGHNRGCRRGVHPERQPGAVR